MNVANDPLEVEGEEIAEIGHNFAISKTLYAETYKIPDSTQVIIDCGGFCETRGDCFEIAVVTSVKLTLEAAKSVKLVVCCDYLKLKVDRAAGFTDMLNTALGTLLGNYEGAEILFLITKPKRDDDLEGRVPERKDIVDFFSEIIREFDENGIAQEKIALYKYLIRDKGKYIIVYNPQKNDSRVQAMGVLNEMSAISPTRGVFNPGCSVRSTLKLREEIVEIAVAGKELFARYTSNLQAAAARDTDISVFEKSITKIRENIVALGNDSPTAIENLKVVNLEIVERVNLEIGRLEVAIQEGKAEIVAIGERIALADTDGEVDELYDMQCINQEGINVESKSTSTVTKETLSTWFWRGFRNTETTETSTYDKRAITHDFNYSGPQISKIVMSPSEGHCWSQEKKESHKFSICYQTAKGEDADAKIEIYVQKKHFPDKERERAGLVTSKEAEEKRILAFQLQIAEQNQRKISAERLHDSFHNKLERLNEYGKTLDELQEQLRFLQAQAQLLKDEEIEILNEIEANKPDFKFLVDYFNLSQDGNLQTKDTVIEFLKLYETFQKRLGQ